MKHSATGKGDDTPTAARRSARSASVPTNENNHSDQEQGDADSVATPSVESPNEDANDSDYPNDTPESPPATPIKTRKKRNTVSNPSPRTPTPDKAKDDAAEEQRRIKERINRCLQKVRPITIERKTAYVERHFPDIGEANTSYVANYLFESEVNRSHFLTPPSEWDSDDTDDETLRAKECTYLNNKGITEPTSDEDDEYPLAHSDIYHRALFANKTKVLNKLFGTKCSSILGKKIFQKKRITAKLAVLYGMYHDQMLEWSSIATIVTKLKQSRASNIDDVFHAAVHRELDEYSDRAAKNQQKVAKTSIVAQRAQFERVSASTLLKN
ncbi:MAG: hypothetical protein GY822_13890, partial [Deltaproteobacteria bacterium]|nr:hypothetical protein [Deltaproteobacteria bacterium]